MCISHNEVHIFFIFYLGTRPRNCASKASTRAVGKACLLAAATAAARHLTARSTPYAAAPQKTKTEHKQLRLCFIEPALIKEALIKSRLTTWHTSCLQIFRHLARKLLEIRKYSCVAFVQADKKSDGAICAPDLISTSLKSLM